ncbi:MAG TPA: GNAT family N-acetyltransferase [Candidatus Eisenbacteria bacterium]|nr:GNAT family N-acetyltransferase [Candidatus Eisenbacteria bacterium]
MRPERSAPGTIGPPSPQDWETFLLWARLEGWRVPARELALYREELADSAFVLRASDGAALGFVTVCRHRQGGWIGNLIVDPARRGEGLGRRLFRHAAGVLSARGASALWLTASAAGRPLYEECGFREAGRVERWSWRGEVPAPSGGGGGGGDLYALARADAAAWGDSRVALLTLLARGGQVLAAGRTVALLQPADELCVLGPWLSADLCPRANRTVLAQAMTAAAGRDLAVDVIGGSPVRILLHAAGFRQAGETVLMVRGEPGAFRPGEVVALASLGSMG